jgi:hypothetical protein
MIERAVLGDRDTTSIKFSNRLAAQTIGCSSSRMGWNVLHGLVDDRILHASDPGQGSNVTADKWRTARFSIVARKNVFRNMWKLFASDEVSNRCRDIQDAVLTVPICVPSAPKSHPLETGATLPASEVDIGPVSGWSIDCDIPERCGCSPCTVRRLGITPA